MATNADWASVARTQTNWEVGAPAAAQTFARQVGSAAASLVADPGAWAAIILLGLVILTWPVRKRG